MEKGKYKQIVMLSKHNNVATLWLVSGFREIEAYEAAADFTEAINSETIIEEQVHIIDDDEAPYNKLTHPWEVQHLHAHPRKLAINLNK